jgi:hypothetical protein
MPGPDQILTNIVRELLTPLYQATVGIAILYFLYGVVKYVIDLNNPEKQTYGKSHLLWGTVGLFIILSVGGILRVLNSFIGGMFK